MKRFTLPSLCLPALLLPLCGTSLSAQEPIQTEIIRKYEVMDRNIAYDKALIGEEKMHRQHQETLEVTGFGKHEWRDPCKVFIGVGTESESGKLRVEYTVDDTPAETYGVQPGDIILAFDGVPVNSQSALIRERDKHQQGDAFTLSILRAGKEMKIDARFRQCSAEELQHAREMEQEHAQHMDALNEHMAEMNERIAAMSARMAEMNIPQMEGLPAIERPILGIYPDESIENVQGVGVGSVIGGKGAAAAGLQPGDVITEVDGKTVGADGSISEALAGHKPGDKVPVSYRRGGQTLKTEVTLSADRSGFVAAKRDPCAVFIGIYTGSTPEGRGQRVTGVIENTPAQLSGVQAGDVILALDGAPVNSYMELLNERNKHQPGETFRLGVLREGAAIEIEAKFKVCPKAETPSKPAEETVELVPEETPAEARTDPENNGTELQLVNLNVFPNPTSGPVDIRFEAAAAPTVVRITDASGRVVYDKVLNQFSGQFAEQVNLFGRTPGTYTLTVMQEGKSYVRKIILMSRA